MKKYNINDSIKTKSGQSKRISAKDSTPYEKTYQEVMDYLKENGINIYGNDFSVFTRPNTLIIEPNKDELYDKYFELLAKAYDVNTDWGNGRIGIPFLSKRKTAQDSLSQEIGKYYKEFDRKYGLNLDDLVYGKDGFMNSCYPDGFPDFMGDVIFSEKYWNEFEKWLKDVKGITLQKKENVEDSAPIKDDKLIPPTEECLKEVETKLEENGWEIVSKGDNFFDGVHYQIVSKRDDFTLENWKDFVNKNLKDVLFAVNDIYDCRPTFASNLMEDGTITAGVDIWQMYIKGAEDSNPIKKEDIEKYTKPFKAKMKDSDSSLIGSPEDSNGTLAEIRFWSSGYTLNKPVYVYAEDINEDVLSRASILDPNCSYFEVSEVIEGDQIIENEDFFDSKEAYQNALDEYESHEELDGMIFDKSGWCVGWPDTYVYLDRSMNDASNIYLCIENLSYKFVKRDTTNNLQNEFFAKYENQVEDAQDTKINDKKKYTPQEMLDYLSHVDYNFDVDFSTFVNGAREMLMENDGLLEEYLEMYGVNPEMDKQIIEFVEANPDFDWYRVRL